MHGIVFNALRDFSVDRLGAEAAALAWAGTDFEPDGAYDDRLFLEQLERVAAANGEPCAAVEHAFGVFAATTTFPGLFPGYYAESEDTAAFLLGIEERIHEVVRATIPGSAPPELHVVPFQGLGVIVTYTSPRRLCSLLAGLIAGTAAKLGDSVQLEQIQCMLLGDPGCVFTVVRT